MREEKCSQQEAIVRTQGQLKLLAASTEAACGQVSFVWRGAEWRSATPHASGLLADVRRRLEKADDTWRAICALHPVRTPGAGRKPPPASQDQDSGNTSLRR